LTGVKYLLLLVIAEDGASTAYLPLRQLPELPGRLGLSATFALSGMTGCSNLQSSLEG